MDWLDKLLGRSKKMAGEMAGDSSMQHEGMATESEGMAGHPAAMHEEAGMEARDETAEEGAGADRESM